MVAAVLLAGIAQAAHFHKSEFVSGSSSDVHCLLCLYAAGSAAPPAPTQLIATAMLSQRAAPCPRALPCPRSHAPASYDARGPPSV